MLGFSGKDVFTSLTFLWAKRKASGAWRRERGGRRPSPPGYVSAGAGISICLRGYPCHPSRLFSGRDSCPLLGNIHSPPAHQITSNSLSVKPETPKPSPKRPLTVAEIRGSLLSERPWPGGGLSRECGIVRESVTFKNITVGCNFLCVFLSVAWTGAREKVKNSVGHH